MLSMDRPESTSLSLGFFPPGSPLRLGSSLCHRADSLRGPRCAVQATGTRRGLPTHGWAPGVKRKSLCAQTDPRAGRHSGEGVGRTSWRGLVRGLPCSPARFGGPTLGPGPPTARERPEEPQAPAPGLTGSRLTGPRTRTAPLHPAQGAAGLLPNFPGRGVLGPARRPPSRTGAGRHRRPRIQDRRWPAVHLQDGRRPAPPSTPSGRAPAGTSGKQPASGSSCAPPPRERGPAGPAGFPPGPLGRRAGRRGLGGPHLRRELWTPGAAPAAPPGHAACCAGLGPPGSGFSSARAPSAPCRPRPTPGRRDAPRRPGSAPRRSPRRGLCGTGRWEASPPERRARPPGSWPSHPVSSPACPQGWPTGPLGRAGTGLGAFVQDPRRPGWRLAAPATSQRPL